MFIPRREICRDAFQRAPKAFALAVPRRSICIRDDIAVDDEVIDVFATAGLKNPDISILSDQFLADVRAMPHRNFGVEILRKVLAGEVKARSKHNLVQARSFAEMLEKSVRRYQKRVIEAAQVIEELIQWLKRCAKPTSAARSSV